MAIVRTSHNKTCEIATESVNGVIPCGDGNGDNLDVIIDNVILVGHRIY